MLWTRARARSRRRRPSARTTALGSARSEHHRSRRCGGAVRQVGRPFALHRSSRRRGFELIAERVREASCPVIALLSAKDPTYVDEAAKRGVFAYIVDTTPEELQGAIEV